MTKKKLYGIVYQKSIYKILLTMKLTFLLTFVTVFQLAATGYSQKARVSIHVNNASYLDVFNEIEKQSEYRIFYKVDQLDPDKRFDLAVKNETVADVLRDVLSSSRSSFDLMDRIIVITPDALAQQKVTGRVTDVENGEPLPGVNISVEGTTTGVTTDVDGNYSITVPRDGKALIFSYVGYVSQRIEYTDQTSIDVELSPEVKKLDEVVVVGYGTQKRSDITGSVTSVPKDRLSKIPVTNLTYALEGSAAGLNVTQTSSVPGSSGTMRIRGVNSINASTSPFIVLDGIPFFGSMNDINPNDIESIEILKDASAVAIYGTRGANGVILITTKRGSETSGAPKITYNGYVGVEGMEHVLTPMDPATYVQKYADFNTQNGLTQTEVLPNSSEVENYNNGITTDWLKQATQTGNIQEHNLSISGGTENVQYYVSVNHMKEKGVVKGYQYQRTGFRSNVDSKINDYLKVGTSAFLTDNNYDGGRVNFLEANAMSPYSVPYDENGENIIYPMYPEQLFANPLLGLSVDRLDRGLNLTGNGYAEVTPGFLKGLKYRLNASYIYNIFRTAMYTGRDYNDQSGTATVTNTHTNNWVIENILSYNKDFGKHHIDITALYSAQKVKYFRSQALSRGFPNDALSYFNMSAGLSQSDSTKGNDYTLASQMGRINYSYDSRYLLTVTARRDGYSAFGSNTDKYGLFPSVAVGWNIANEEFMKNKDLINQLKVRLSYGLTGNQAIAPNQTASIANTVQYPFGGSALTGVIYNRMGNPNLNWESTTALNLGIDFGILKNRISGTVEVYKTKTKDILLRRNLPSITGYQNIWVNLGQMQNVGVDLNLRTVNIRSDDFRWETSLNFSTYKNKILELYGDGRDDIGNTWFIGEPLHVIYDYEKLGIWQEGRSLRN